MGNRLHIKSDKDSKRLKVYTWRSIFCIKICSVAINCLVLFIDRFNVVVIALHFRRTAVTTDRSYCYVLFIVGVHHRRFLFHRDVGLLSQLLEVPGLSSRCDLRQLHVRKRLPLLDVGGFSAESPISGCPTSVDVATGVFVSFRALLFAAFAMLLFLWLLFIIVVFLQIVFLASNVVPVLRFIRIALNRQRIDVSFSPYVRLGDQLNTSSFLHHFTRRELIDYSTCYILNTLLGKSTFYLI